MPWKRPTKDEIFNDIKADIEERVTNNIALPIFSIYYILAVVFTGAIHLCYGVLEWLARQLFLDTAEQDYVGRKLNLHDVRRKQDQFANALVTFAKSTSGNETIVKGTIVQDEATGIQYETIAGIEVPGLGSADVGIIAVEAGKDSNTSNSDAFYLTLQKPIVGITIEAPSIGGGLYGVTGGEDGWTDNQYKEAGRQKIQHPPAGGRDADYIQWAKEAPGGGAYYVWVTGADETSNKVTVTVADVDYGTSAINVPVIQDYINSKRPNGVNVTVVAAVPVKFTYVINIAPYTFASAQEFQQSVFTELNDMYKASVEPGGEVLISKTRTAIADTKINDYVIATITKGGSSQTIDDIQLGTNEIPYIEFATDITVGTKS